MADIMLGQLLHRPTIDPISGDSPLPVQLSGSFVAEEKIKTALSIGAGATVYLYGGLGTTAGCPKVAIALMTTDGSTPKVSATLFPVFAGGVCPSGAQMAIDNVMMNAYKACSMPLAMATLKVDFAITNHDTAAHAFDVYLYRMADTRW